MSGSPQPSATSAKIGQLLEASRDGDRDSLNEIVRELTPLLWHIARAQGLDAESSSDVVQNTWLSLLRAMSDIKNPAALTAWLVRVTKREAWRVARAQRSERPTDAADFYDRPDPGPDPEQQALTAEGNQRLWTLLRRLPERCQRLLRIVAFVPRPDYNEISAELGTPHGTIGPTRGRCLARLRVLLETGTLDDQRRAP